MEVEAGRTSDDQRSPRREHDLRERYARYIVGAEWKEIISCLTIVHPISSRLFIVVVYCTALLLLQIKKFYSIPFYCLLGKWTHMSNVFMQSLLTFCLFFHVLCVFILYFMPSPIL